MKIYKKPSIKMATIKKSIMLEGSPTPSFDPTEDTESNETKGSIFDIED